MSLIDWAAPSLPTEVVSGVTCLLPGAVLFWASQSWRVGTGALERHEVVFSTHSGSS